MNKLPLQKRAQILQMLCEGNSLRATARMADVAYNTVLKIVPLAGQACADYQDKHLRDLSCKRIQVDEIWAFVYAKAKNVSDEKKLEGAGDIWTWVAICDTTKPVPSFLVGHRDFEHARLFMQDLKGRLLSRVQLTSDGFRSYLQAVEEAFGEDVDFAQLVKVYGESTGLPKGAQQRRYSPGEYVKSYKEVIRGNPEKAYVSTSYVERQNLTIRVSMRRFTRLTNAFSKKVENHYYGLALHFMNYNFSRIHQSLKVTPAMEAGIADHVWTYEEIAALMD